MSSKTEFGLIGLGVMGKSLAVNMAGKGISLSVYNRHVPGKEEYIAQNFVDRHKGKADMQGFDDIHQFVDSLQKPRSILFMVSAGPAVDMIIESLLPLLEREDIIIDGGNSHYADSARRANNLEAKGIRFIGMGISGGEEGALKGPSLMPGGSKEGYKNIARYLEKIAATDKNGFPCCAYIGPEGAGHFVKMIHNGIEYGEMQLLAEAYYLLRNYSEYPLEKIADIFESWRHQELDSYILEITIDILRTKENGEPLLDKILDAAKQKNTGSWTVEAAFELGVPLSTMSEAVTARFLSSLKDQRLKATNIYSNGRADIENREKLPSSAFSNSLMKAYKTGRIINHAMGFDLLSRASQEYNWAIDLSEIARIWTNGCIIRSSLMEKLAGVLRSDIPLLQQDEIVHDMNTCISDLKNVVSEGLLAGCALPVLSAALNYFLGYTSGQSPANLIQAQRDYFGAHTYQRVDRPLTEHFHTQWTK